MTTPLRLLALLAAGAALGASASPADAARPLRTSIHDSVNLADPVLGPIAFGQAARTGATQVRLILHWVSVANRGRRPSNPRQWNHGDYNWGWFDDQMRRARAHGLTPIVSINEAPAWATPAGKNHRPSAKDLADFAYAAAVRYSGKKTLPGDSLPLPRARYWQIWNEPNRNYFLAPQFQGGRMVSPDLYRGMVRRMSAAVRSVDSRNRVIAGGLAPIGRKAHPAPLAFMRKLLCVSRKLKRTCNLRPSPVRFDVWAHHPYTLGSPTRRTAKRDDVMISGLPKMRKLLRAAVRLGHVRSRGAVQFWATEFSWDTAPPDPKAVPAGLHARWTSEALYRMWKAGISSVTWYKIQDDPLPCSRYQSGFFSFTGGQKRSLTAFRFPLVAFRSGKRIKVWGRTPEGRRGTVQLMVKPGRRWRLLGRVRTSVHGVFQRTYTRPYRRGTVVASFRGEKSLPFSLTRPRERSLDPFGIRLGPGCP